MSHSLSLSLSAFANYLNRMKLTESNNTDGIQDLCNYFAFVCLLSLNQRCRKQTNLKTVSFMTSTCISSV